jgi:hypothetical protein
LIGDEILKTKIIAIVLAGLSAISLSGCSPKNPMPLVLECSRIATQKIANDSTISIVVKFMSVDQTSVNVNSYSDLGDNKGRIVGTWTGVWKGALAANGVASGEYFCDVDGDKVTWGSAEVKNI